MMLRKLTRLSKIDFGFHAGKTVDQILKHRTGKSYITWLYFNASHIDLCDELLQELKITHILIKPGKDPEIFDNNYHEVSKFKMKDTNWRIHKMHTHYDIRYSKSSLQYKNRNKY